MTLADDVSVVTNAQCLAYVVVGDQDANAARLQKTDDALNLNDGDRVDAGKGFVQQNKAGLGGQGAGDLDAAALAARQCRRRRVTQMLDAQFMQQAVGALLDVLLAERLACGIALQLEHGAHVFFNREFAKYRGLLRQVAQAEPGAAVNWHALDRLAVDADLPGVGAHQADDHVKRSGFAGAVGP